MPIELRPDLALFEVRQEDAVHATRQEPGEVVLAKVQGEVPEIVTTVDHHVEDVELHLVVVLPGMQAVEVRNAIDAEQYGLTIDTKKVARMRSAASVIRGYRSDQS